MATSRMAIRIAGVTAVAAAAVFASAFAAADAYHDADARAASGTEVSHAPSDSADVVAAVARFHASLAAGDTATILGLLSEDVAILESGGMETKSTYRAGHMSADIEYAKAIPSAQAVSGVRVRGDVAWVTSTSSTQGEFRGRQVNSVGAELAVLSREGNVWKIRAVHWSSRTRRAP